MQDHGIIKNLKGEVLFSFTDAASGKPRWNEIISELAQGVENRVEHCDFSRQINEPLTVTGVGFKDCIFDFDHLQRSSFIDCRFERVRFFNTSFHHLSDRADKVSNRSIGTLFKNCHFDHARFEKSDLVMSKFYDCDFSKSSFVQSDLRNVFWFDRLAVQAVDWENIPDMGDPFADCFLDKCYAGHPMGNMMNLPFNMMVPASYKKIWGQMGAVQRRLTKIAYIMREDSSYAFQSAI